MFTIAYNKNTKKLIMAHFDNAQGMEKPSPQDRLNLHCEGNNLNVNDYVALEVPYDKNLILILGNHMYNELNNSIVADPNYAPPKIEPVITM